MSEVPSVGAWIVPADLKHLNRKIDRARSAIERARKITTAPQQTPGPLVAGASNYSMGKKLAAENNRRAAAFCAQLQAEADLAHYTWVRDGYIQGANWPNGQRRVPGRVESRAVAHLRQVAYSSDVGT